MIFPSLEEWQQLLMIINRVPHEVVAGDRRTVIIHDVVGITTADNRGPTVTRPFDGTTTT